MMVLSPKVSIARMRIFLPLITYTIHFRYQHILFFTHVVLLILFVVEFCGFLGNCSYFLHLNRSRCLCMLFLLFNFSSLLRLLPLTVGTFSVVDFFFVVVMWMEMYDYERCMEVNDAIQNILWMAHTKKAHPTHKFIKLLEKMPFYWRREMASVGGYFFLSLFLLLNNLHAKLVSQLNYDK